MCDTNVHKSMICAIIVYGKYVWENLNYQVWIFDATKPVQQEMLRDIYSQKNGNCVVINVIWPTFPQNHQLDIQ